MFTGTALLGLLVAPQQPQAAGLDAQLARAAWAEITAFERDVVVEVAPQVDARQWQRRDDAGKRALLLDELADHTARLAVDDRGQGRCVAQGKGVRSFALSLAAEQLGKDGAVEVRWQNRASRHKVAPDAAVLLRDFVERFDRTCLPVARVEVR